MSEIQEFLDKVYGELKGCKKGKVADYIPQLAKVNPDLFGISVCTIDGEFYSVGDVENEFCLQSCSKPLSYCIARETLGSEVVHNHVGYEPSGREFNAFCLNKQGLPHNPMINAGAIMVASMLAKDCEPAEQFDTVKAKYLELAGGIGKINFDNSVFLSERQHADRNISLAYYMRENKAFMGSPEPSRIQQILDLYFQCCSILIDSHMGASISATLANGGFSPISKKRVFSSDTIRDCLTLMYGCGMYDFSGQFSFEIGLPAKSGVSGCVFVVVPNVMGMCIYSPRLDDQGNSVRGIEVSRRVKDYFKAHIFQNIIDYRLDDKYINNTFIQAAADNDLKTLNKLINRVDINKGDYDKRNALHLAVAEGNLRIVKYLINKGADKSIKDRWGNNALDILKDSKKNKETELPEKKYEEILKLLSNDKESN